MVNYYTWQDQLKGLTWPADWSNRVHSTSRLGEVRVKEVCFNHQDPVLHHHRSQHTANVLPHLVWLLRQARGCCGPIRSTPDPHRALYTIRLDDNVLFSVFLLTGSWWLKHTSLTLTSPRREVDWTRFDQSAGHVKPFNWSCKHCLYVLIILTWLIMLSK
jgi:hypothetical protein